MNPTEFALRNMPSPSATIEVWDERAYLPSTPKMVVRHTNVPNGWTTATVMERFGIGQHMTVYRSAPGEMRRIIHHGAD